MPGAVNRKAATLPAEDVYRKSDDALQAVRLRSSSFHTVAESAQWPHQQPAGSGQPSRWDGGIQNTATRMTKQNRPVSQSPALKPHSTAGDDQAGFADHKISGANETASKLKKSAPGHRGLTYGTGKNETVLLKPTAIQPKPRSAEFEQHFGPAPTLATANLVNPRSAAPNPAFETSGSGSISQPQAHPTLDVDRPAVHNDCGAFGPTSAVKPALVRNVKNAMPLSAIPRDCGKQILQPTLLNGHMPPTISKAVDNTAANLAPPRTSRLPRTTAAVPKATVEKRPFTESRQASSSQASGNLRINGSPSNSRIASCGPIGLPASQVPSTGSNRVGFISKDFRFIRGPSASAPTMQLTVMRRHTVFAKDPAGPNGGGPSNQLPVTAWSDTGRAADTARFSAAPFHLEASRNPSGPQNAVRQLGPRFGPVTPPPAFAAAAAPTVESLQIQRFDADRDAGEPLSETQGSVSAPTVGETPISAEVPQRVDIERLADEVYTLLEQRLVIERESRGL
jgi:hypothetical protein